MSVCRKTSDQKFTEMESSRPRPWLEEPQGQLTVSLALGSMSVVLASDLEFLALALGIVLGLVISAFQLILW